MTALNGSKGRLAGMLCAVMLFAGAANATIISFSNGFSLTNTDVTDVAISMTPFIPGNSGIPVNAILDSYRITYAQQVAGAITIFNDGGSAQNVSGTVDTIGALYLFSSTPAGDLTGGFISPKPFNPTDDIFGGSGPDVSKTSSKAGLAAGSSFGPTAYDITVSANTAFLTSNLNSVKSSWSAYADSGTATTTTVTNSGAGHTSYSNQVAGLVTVDYNYHLLATPEPGTMGLLGGALAGLAFFRKRIRK